MIKLPGVPPAGVTSALVVCAVIANRLSKASIFFVIEADTLFSIESSFYSIYDIQLSNVTRLLSARLTLLLELWPG